MHHVMGPRDQVLSLPKDTSIAAVLAVSEFPADDFLLLLTRQGTIKKTPLQAFQDIRANGLCAIRLNVRYPSPLPLPVTGRSA